MFISSKLLPNRWIRLNADGLILGLIVGTLIIFFSLILTDLDWEWDDIFGNMMFSVLISLSISNAICLSETLLRKNFRHQWALITAYYGGCLLGMFAGTELSYLMLRVIFGIPYKFMGHPTQLAFNLTISVVVCTILYIYELQKGRFGSRIQQQELELLKLKQLKTQAELQTLQSKINPHFLYNSLNSIAGLIHEDADKAEDMTLKLSKLFRYSINSQHENFATVREEVETVNTYMAIENIRFGDRINFNICAGEDVLDKAMPRFLIQPLVENALKHGLSNKIADGKLEVIISSKDSQLTLSVADNGEAFPDELSAGYGLQSTYDKLQLLYPDNYEIQILNSPEKKITINFPSAP
ncbi:hypothetical protein GZH53_11430 [Flavihumibacter sp. R14]|nr:hypothetical protein [Flavihumibacter soli]